MRKGIAITSICALLAAAPSRAAEEVSFEVVSQRAAALAAAPFQEGLQPSPSRSRMTYDEYRDLRFDPACAVWRGANIPFQLQFFLPGWVQNDAVIVHLLDHGDVVDYPCRADLFLRGTNRLTAAQLGPEPRFSGFRVHYPLNSSRYFDELAVFQGATYFRALAQGSAYGLCARTVTVDCGYPVPEEFPRFREFWIERPSNSWYSPLDPLRLVDSPSIRVLGLFDGPSLAGAAEFVITPGAATVMDCRVAFHARRRVAHLGVAPLTSMFWYGPASRRRFEDFRPEVHDSDGLLVENGGGEWIWRPLLNHNEVRLCSFLDRTTTGGFGLVQRERRFAAYEDLEARYQDRPSAWVEPCGDWGAGAVKLLEIPTENEFGDNIVAYWEPAAALEPGKPRVYAYRLRWFPEDEDLPPLGRVVSTRIADMADPEDVPLVADGKTVVRKFVLDFSWPGVETVRGHRKLDIDVSAGSAMLVGRPVQQLNAPDGTWRVFFKVKAPRGAEATDLRLVLRRRGRPVTETWTYLWKP